MLHSGSDELQLTTTLQRQLSTSERFDCSLCCKQFATVHGLEARTAYSPTFDEKKCNLDN